MTSDQKSKKKCEQCRDTGWYGDNGPGIRGNREYVPCECRDPGYTIWNGFPFKKDLLKKLEEKKRTKHDPPNGS